MKELKTHNYYYLALTLGCLCCVAGTPKQIIFWGRYSRVFGVHPIAGLQREKE